VRISTAVVIGTCIVLVGAIGVRADTDVPTEDTVADEVVSATNDMSVASATDSTRSEAISLLSGNWSAAETAKEKKQRLEAIDEVTDDLGRLKRGKARSLLAENTSPPESLMIELTDSTATIAFEDRRLELELGGSPIEVTGTEEKTRVSAKMEGGKLIVLFQGDKGNRTTTYQADGTGLSMEVTITDDNLAGPLRYVATFARIE
jgi:hypothetical protein